MNKDEQKLVDRIELLKKDIKFKTELEIEIAHYKLRFGENWIWRYIEHAGAISKRENDGNKLFKPRRNG